MTDVVPMLSYEDCGAASDWLSRAFGFDEVERIADRDGTVSHVTLRAGDGLVFLGRPGDSYVNPLHLRERSDAAARMYEVPFVVDGVCVLVAGLDTHFARARDAGARVLSGLEDTSHGRIYRAEDPEGHRWMFQERSRRA